MRLVNTDTLQLETFEGRIPPYAILSHTWLDAEDEVTMQDLKQSLQSAQAKKGYQKLRGSAHLAFTQEIDYIWIDTCCIDKTSSAELSEAINSMYKWYRDAVVCYAYLSDVGEAPDPGELNSSRWFTRGWTLQELIAPREMEFYSNDWVSIGHRNRLVSVIGDITNIPRSVLSGGSLRNISAGAKLSWAASRITTRAEDGAYCLMGILGVNMPLLYGEGGKKAFRRLQEEFLKSQDDESIFAWTVPSRSDSRQRQHWGLLASSPAYFRSAGPITRPPFKSRIHQHPTSITNHGTSVELSLCPFEGDKSGTIYLGLLNCTLWGDVLAIVLQRVSDMENQYVRIAPGLLIKINLNFYNVPFNQLSPQYRREHRQRQGSSILRRDSGMEEAGSAFLRVADPEPQLIFVRANVSDSELLAGFYLVPEIVSDVPYSGGVEVTRVTCSYPWHDVQQPKQGSSAARRCYMLRLDDLNEAERFGTLRLDDLEEYERFRVDMLKSREYIAGLEIEVTCPPEGERAAVAKTFSLLVGLEPIPENPFQTLPLFIKPWYILVSRPFDESWVSGIVKLGDIESLKAGQLLSNGLNLRVRFSTGMRYEELMYKIELVLSGT